MTPQQLSAQLLFLILVLIMDLLGKETTRVCDGIDQKCFQSAAQTH